MLRSAGNGGFADITAVAQEFDGVLARTCRLLLMHCAFSADTGGLLVSVAVFHHVFKL